MLLLLLGAVSDESGSDHAYAHGENSGGGDALGLFFFEDALQDAGEPLAAELLRPGQPGPAVVVFDALPVAALLHIYLLFHAVGDVSARRSTVIPPDLRRKLFQKRNRPLSELSLFRRIVKIHKGLS